MLLLSLWAIDRYVIISSLKVSLVFVLVLTRDALPLFPTAPRNVDIDDSFIAREVRSPVKFNWDESCTCRSSLVSSNVNRFCCLNSTIWSSIARRSRRGRHPNPRGSKYAWVLKFTHDGEHRYAIEDPYLHQLPLFFVINEVFVDLLRQRLLQRM